MTASGRPNIVVLMADDHRGTEMSHLPRSGARTPHLDALAARGVPFAQAHCQGSMMGAVCVPSRASLLTGRNIFASAVDPTGVRFGDAQTIPAHLETFPQALRAAGYQTHAVGKWHNDLGSFQRSFSGGEALMFGGMSDHYRVPAHAYDPSGAYAGLEPEAPGGKRPSKDEIDLVTADEAKFSSNLFGEAAIRFIEQDHEDPFLLYVAFTAPHDPRTPPRGWEVDPAEVELPPNFLPEHPFDNGEMAVRDELLAGKPRSEAEVRQHIADYYGMIAHLDHTVGRIVSAIEANGLADDTVVIYTGDHGLAVGQHGLMGKQNLYEHSLRIPLVLAGPGVPRGVVSDELVWHGDTTATIRAVAGIEPDPEAEGRSLIGVDGRIRAGRDSFGAAYMYGQRTFWEGRHKLIAYQAAPDGNPGNATSPGSDHVQLFDLEADPWEMTNLANDPGYRDIRKRLEDGLLGWQESVGDPLLASR
ncbi:MAG: sulfatase-like hydrolase/transferase [Chloroflexota bacterium]|nr:sulfatase-like hydrolase/transferase [Chloroflexota bacterium]